jgi:hypothetical protein
MPMQSSVDHTLLLESVKSTKVVMSMQSLGDPTLLLGSDVSIDYVLIISSLVLSEQGCIPLISSTSPQVLGWFPLIGMTLLSLSFLLMHLLK